MRLRLGILQETAAIDKQIAKEAAEAAAKKHKHAVATVKTEAQTAADAKEAAKEKSKAAEPPRPMPKPRIRPLSEAKAIETGANFISEGFLFGVAGALIIFEAWRSRRKETNRREDVADRIGDLEESERAARAALVELEKEVLMLRAKHTNDTTQSGRRILPRQIWETEAQDKEDEVDTRGWLSRISSYILAKKEEPTPPERQLGPAEKILVASDAALAEKHRKALEEAEKERAKVDTRKVS